MNVGGFRSMSVTLLLFAASVAIMAAASAGRLSGSVNRELTIAIVDTERTTAARNEFRAEVAARLRSALNDTCGVVLRAVYVGGRDAKLKLNGGRYDAALVIGQDRPFSLRRMQQLTLAGSMAASTGLQPVSLIIGNANPALSESLRQAFARLLAAPSSPMATNPTSPGANLATIGG